MSTRTVATAIVSIATLSITGASLLGCAAPSDVPATEEPSDASAKPQEGASEPAAAAAPPAGAQVVCHLDCSGNQADGYGATEAEARADVTQHVDKLCKPEDGQYFIFCEPAK